MQYYIFTEKLHALMEKQHLSCDQLLSQCEYPANGILPFLKKSGPTRNTSIIGALCRVLNCWPKDFCKIKLEPGDAEKDSKKIMRQNTLPLDTDASHFFW